MSLRNKAISGFSWTFAQQFGLQLLSFIVSICLARLLSPQEFGLIALLGIFMGIGACLTDGGLTSSLIRTESPTQADLSTIFYLNLIGSGLIYLLLFFFAPLIGSFYNQPVLCKVVRVYSLVIIINAFNAVQATLLTKEMKFKTQMLIQIPALIGGGIVGIVLAYLHFGVWSLVWMNVVQASINCILHWMNSSWYPQMLFDKIKFKYHFKFGYKLTLSGLLDTVFENIYSIVIGKFYAPAQLAFYNRANSLQMLPVQNISAALNKVSFPLFVQIKNDNFKLKKAYKLLLTQVVFWIVPVMLIINLCAQPIVKLLLTEKWLPAVPFLKILSFYGMLYPLHVYNLNILLVKGRSDLFLRLEIIKKLLFLTGMIIAFQFGLIALAWWQVIYSVGSFFINTHYSGAFIDYPGIRQLIDIIPSLIVGFVLFFCFNFSSISPNIFNMSPLLNIGVTTMGFMILYLLISYIVKNNALTDLYSIIKKKSLI